MEKAEEFRAETAENSPYGQKGFPAFTAWNPFHLHVADKYYRYILLLIPPTSYPASSQWGNALSNHDTGNILPHGR